MGSTLFTKNQLGDVDYSKNLSDVLVQVNANKSASNSNTSDITDLTESFETANTTANTTATTMQGQIDTVGVVANINTSDITALTTSLSDKETSLQADIDFTKEIALTLVGEVADIGSTADTSQEDIDALASTSSSHNAKILTLESDYATLSTNVAHHEERLDAFDTNYGSLGSQVSASTALVAILQETVDGIDPSVNSARIDDLETSEGLQNARMTAIEANHNALNTAFGTAQDDIDALEITSTSHTSSISTLETDYGTLNTVATDNATAIATLQGQVSVPDTVSVSVAASIDVNDLPDGSAGLPEAADSHEIITITHNLGVTPKYLSFHAGAAYVSYVAGHGAAVRNSDGSITQSCNDEYLYPNSQSGGALAIFFIRQSGGLSEGNGFKGIVTEMTSVHIKIKVIAIGLVAGGDINYGFTISN